MLEITVTSELANLAVVNEFVTAYLDGAFCPPKLFMKIGIAVDEIFTNICSYAYEGAGDVTVRISPLEPAGVMIEFIDGGKPYDPLSAKDPDITLSAEDRKIGGLGIFIVKKTMDDMTYRRENGKNVLSVKKYFV